MDVEGIPLRTLRALPDEELDALLAFGRPVTVRIGTATVLLEFNRSDDALIVNLAHVDGGGEGVMLSIWKAIAAYAVDRKYHTLTWHVHALTCAKPNPRLQAFLRGRGFEEIAHAEFGKVLGLSQTLPPT